ncbi:hypothetical protein COCCADRAFT_8428 [Bipolaris zeicola 26-R-13]|uniref:Uncharacterized protein n=1 Tax=Cochliobolus carbonum (strain 26-R-13) TaxID=930089 RepID=W6Y2T1_COCC2|nr:uncharacterized protein COCCADRAFT_8428 [Bipolaris zeicola 26-R-13]EUC29364.1 hypothetical protein COCCADRAFT_8428 [Bipolaris zeicola 26-R-13]
MELNGAGIAAGRSPESRREDKAVVLDGLSQRPPGRSSALFTWAHEPLQPENPDQDCHGSPNISLDLDPVRPSFCLSVCLSACPSVYPSTPSHLLTLTHPPIFPCLHPVRLAAGAGAGAGTPALALALAVAVAVAAGAAAAAVAAVAATALLSPSPRCAAPRLASPRFT